MSEDDFTEEDYRLVAGKYDALLPYEAAWSSSVAILIRRGSTARVHGTGTLFRIADESFLITATHVHEEAKGQNLLIAASHGKIIPLEGTALLTDRDTLDVAVIQLASRVVADLDDNLFLRLNYVCFQANLSEAMFWVCGFPEMMARHENGILTLTRFQHTASAYEGDTSSLTNYQDKYHLLVAADLSETRDLDGKLMDFCYPGGVSAPFPKELKGISGGSVWKIADSPADTKRKGSEKARIVGVETGIYQDKECIKATRWIAVVNVIGAAIPELRSAIEMFRGNS